MEQKKSLIAVTVDGIVIFAGFVIGKYVAPDWAGAIIALIASFQPAVIYLVGKWLGVEMLIRAGVLPGKIKKSK
jgi:hypothetical protein